MKKRKKKRTFSEKWRGRFSTPTVEQLHDQAVKEGDVRMEHITGRYLKNLQ